MEGFSESCVEKYCELTKETLSSLKPVATPSISDDQLVPADFTSKGVLQAHASSVVLKIFFQSRRSRPETMWATNSLARKVTKWDVACDKRLRRLVAFLHHTGDRTLRCFVGNSLTNVLWYGSPMLIWPVTSTTASLRVEV